MKFKKLYLFILAIILVGCNDKSTIESTTQKHFIDFINKRCSEYRTQGNDIQKKEFFKKYIEDITTVFDSIGVLNNWEGNISKLNVHERRSYIELNVEIETEINEYRNFKFSIEEFLENEALDSIYIYQQLRELKVGDKVYFDGLLMKDERGYITFPKTSIYYTPQNNICEPLISIHLISIGHNKINLTTSEEFNRMIDIQNQVWEIMDETSSDNISKSEFQKRLKSFKKELDTLVLNISQEEHEYIKSKTRGHYKNWNQIIKSTISN